MTHHQMSTGENGKLLAELKIKDVAVVVMPSLQQLLQNLPTLSRQEIFTISLNSTWLTVTHKVKDAKVVNHTHQACYFRLRAQFWSQIIPTPVSSQHATVRQPRKSSSLRTLAVSKLNAARALSRRPSDRVPSASVSECRATRSSSTEAESCRQACALQAVWTTPC